MKRLLLVNLSDCPENFHFEKALARAAAARPGLALDVLHDFAYHYDFIGAARPPRGRRRRAPGLAGLKRGWRRPDVLLLLDFAKRPARAASWLWLACQAPAGAKYFVANHLIPMPGQNLAADLARQCLALRGVRAGWMLEFDHRKLWGRLGLGGKALRQRAYACDCEYYRPAGGKPGDYVFSAGSAGRDYAALAAAAAGAGYRLKLLTDSDPAALPAGAEPLPLSKNLHRLKGLAAGAAAVAVPVGDAYRNESAGNSIAFIGMALGRPVLARRTRYMEKFIEDGKNGFLYGKLTPAALAAGLRRIKALAPAAREKLGSAARRTILEKASMDAFCEKFLDDSLRGGD